MTTDVDIDNRLEKLMKAMKQPDGTAGRILSDVFLDAFALCIRKHTDYDGSVWKTPVLAPDIPVEKSIRMRMSDKCLRIVRLAVGHRASVSESLIDTFMDLANYALLWIGWSRLNASRAQTCSPADHQCTEKTGGVLGGEPGVSGDA